MSTNIRSEVSKRNPYYISKHRYYELKHFCLQYPEFRRKYNELCEKLPGGVIRVNNDDVVPVDESAAVRQRYLDQIQLIEDCSSMTDPVIGPYILKGVTEGYTYSYFRTKCDIPCCKDIYYECYRKFFFILDHKKRDA